MRWASYGWLEARWEGWPRLVPEVPRFEAT